MRYNAISGQVTTKYNGIPTLLALEAEAKWTPFIWGYFQIIFLFHWSLFHWVLWQCDSTGADIYHWCLVYFIYSFSFLLPFLTLTIVIAALLYPMLVRVGKKTCKWQLISDFDMVTNEFLWVHIVEYIFIYNHQIVLSLIFTSQISSLENCNIILNQKPLTFFSGTVLLIIMDLHIMSSVKHLTEAYLFIINFLDFQSEIYSSIGI